MMGVGVSYSYSVPVESGVSGLGVLSTVFGYDSFVKRLAAFLVRVNGER
jgi:hypothetical protein